MTALSPDVVADLRQENARLQAELRAARERQAGSAEILRAIADASGDAERSLQRIAEITARLFDCQSVRIRIAENGEWTRTIGVGATAERVGAEVVAAQLRIGGKSLPGTVLHQNRQIHIPDINNLDPSMAEWPGLPPARAAGARVVAGTPLRREGNAIGVLVVYRDRPEPFSADELALLQSFADQAVIAIENARLFNETQAALSRQTATSDILRVISGSPTDVQPVFDAIVLTAARLLGRDMAFVLRCDGATYWCAAMAGPEGPLPVLDPAPVPIDPDANFPSRAIVARKNLHLPDWSAIELPEYEGHIRETYGISSALYLPLLREGECIGVLGMAGKRAGSLGENEIALAESFRDQAVIAIENTRLFNETREALERQTATADILKVIASSPSDVQPVFEAIVGSAAKLFEPCAATIVTLSDENLHWKATAVLHPEFDVERARAIYPLPFKPDHFPSARAIAERRIVEIPDSEAPDASDTPRQAGRISGFRSATFVPLINGAQGIGTIILTHPQAGFRLSEKQLALVQTFADQAVIAIENARLFNETQEALERQTATAEILKVIASSPSDTTPVFEAIATSANRLLGGFSAAVFRFLDGSVHLAAFTPVSPAADAALKADFPRPVDEFEAFRLAQQGKPFPIPDTEEIPHPPIRAIARLHGFRSMLFVPLMNGGVLIGIISVTRLETGTFSPNHIQLLQTFADQAVIAIENTRLFNETKEALERQTATADILKVIASSPNDVQPVFDAIAASAKRLIGGFSTSVFRFVDGVAHVAAFTPTNPAADQLLKASFPRPVAEFPPFELALAGAVVQVPDTEAEPDARMKQIARARGFRSALNAPLMSKETALGLITVTRKDPGSFAGHHVQLLKTFADQAVIAIENVRLFNETKEALERQTATADILKVIASSPTDVQPVFDAIASSANRLIGGYSCTVSRFVDGTAFLKAFTPTTPEADEILQSSFPQPVAGFAPFLMAKAGEVTQVPDTEAMTGGILEISRARGFRSMLFAPLMNKGETIGSIGVTRVQPGSFGDDHVQLLKTFADQAVIAIENTRLFNEVQARTRDLTESLQQQTATAEVLKVISRSAFDLQTVLNTLVESAMTLCNAHTGAIFQKQGELYHMTAGHGYSADVLTYAKTHPITPGMDSNVGRVALTGQVVQISDVLADPQYGAAGYQRVGGYRAMLGVPIMRDGKVEGVFSLARPEPGPFTERQVELLQTFADQAVIAIENVRLFDEVQAKTRDLSEALTYQTGSSNILKVIASSPTDVGPVLKAIVESACELCEADDALAVLKDGEDLTFQAQHGSIPVAWQRSPISRQWASGRAVLDRRAIHVHDVLSAEGEGFPVTQEFARQTNVRTILSVPLLRENESIGAIVLRRTEVHPFSDKQIALLQTFADQAVIAIGNVRLFDEVQARTKELSKSLDDLRTAQDRLVQTEKLASLGQLTAGIAHEIKNPLNFVNNFSALSSELTDELNDVLKQARLAGKIREEVDELTGLLKDNLAKVVQHGKRADSIVKNMLLHSREGSGDHRPADINALVDESLNLAYHGARAEKSQFNVTLQRDFDPNAGMIEVFPQEITRVLLNLISNGFYAVTKRKAENGTGFEPSVIASTRDRGERVEIRIRDNGTGIPPEVKEKMFNPFFTTKPAGEGTGLGLSMSHDIIVKQHGGTIDVATQPGEFTEFTIILPRTSNLSNKSRGQT
jgi:two-component system NtrC family sensor kinase